MRRRGVETRQPNRKVCDELEVSTTALASGRHDSVDRQTTARGKARAMHLSVCCMKLYLRCISNTSESPLEDLMHESCVYLSARPRSEEGPAWARGGATAARRQPPCSTNSPSRSKSTAGAPAAVSIVETYPLGINGSTFAGLPLLVQPRVRVTDVGGSVPAAAPLAVEAHIARAPPGLGTTGTLPDATVLLPSLIVAEGDLQVPLAAQREVCEDGRATRGDRGGKVMPPSSPGCPATAAVTLYMLSGAPVRGPLLIDLD